MKKIITTFLALALLAGCSSSTKVASSTSKKSSASKNDGTMTIKEFSSHLKKTEVNADNWQDFLSVKVLDEPVMDDFGETVYNTQIIAAVPAENSYPANDFLARLHINGSKSNIFYDEDTKQQLDPTTILGEGSSLADQFDEDADIKGDEFDASIGGVAEMGDSAYYSPSNGPYVLDGSVQKCYVGYSFSLDGSSFIKSQGSFVTVDLDKSVLNKDDIGTYLDVKINKSKKYRFYTNGYYSTLKDIKSGNAKTEFDKDKINYRADSVGVLAQSVASVSNDNNVKAMSEFY